MSSIKKNLHITLTPAEQTALIFATDIVGRLIMGDVSGLYYSIASVLSDRWPPPPNRELRQLLDKLRQDIVESPSPSKGIIEDVFRLYLKVSGAQLEIAPKKRGPKSAEIPLERIVTFCPKSELKPSDGGPDKDPI